jgi:hypothetical protein
LERAKGGAFLLVSAGCFLVPCWLRFFARSQFWGGVAIHHRSSHGFCPLMMIEHQTEFSKV